MHPDTDPDIERCGASTHDGGECDLPAGWGCDGEGAGGRCKYHGGMSPGAPEGNQYAQTHAIYSQRSNYYDDLPAVEKAWVDSLVESMMERAMFDEDDFQKFQMVREVAIDMHKKRHANDYLAKEGLIQENLERDEDGEPIFDENGEFVTSSEENPVNLAYDRLDRTMTSKMKDLGLLPDPDSQQAEATQSVAESLSALREEME
jgi:hypothetical protein